MKTGVTPVAMIVAMMTTSKKKEENGNEMSHGIKMVMMHRSMSFFKR